MKIKTFHLKGRVVAVFDVDEHVAAQDPEDAKDTMFHNLHEDVRQSHLRKVADLDFQGTISQKIYEPDESVQTSS